MFSSKIILCFLFFLFLMLNLSKASLIFEPSNLTVTNKIQNQTEAVCLTTSPCRILCRKGIIGNIWKDFPYNKNCSVYSLNIIEYFGKGNEIISKEWFEKINQSTFIEILYIQNSSFKIIEDEAFNSPHFSKTTLLMLNILKVQHLTKYIFIGLSKLTSLQIIDIPLKLIDENVLYSMRYTLNQFLVEKIEEPFSLKNLTGSVTLSNLTYLSLKSNSLSDLIKENSFKGVNKISFLSLSNSGITSLHERTFDYLIRNSAEIDIRLNKLTTLSARTFLFLLQDGVKIYLDYNPWICDCNLLDFKNLLKTFPKYFADVPKCVFPVEFKDQPIIDSDFCTRIN